MSSTNSAEESELTTEIKPVVSPKINISLDLMQFRRLQNLIPTVVKLKMRHGKVLQGCDIYIGRECSRGGWNLPESKWHNPYRVTPQRSVKNAVKLFEIYIRSNTKLLEDIEELFGKKLGCWCYPSPCHGDILVKLAKERLNLPSR